VNVRRPIVFVLLSLLLVLTQQMGFTHALSHWSGQRTSETAQLTAQMSDDDEDGPKAQSFDQSCEQCLAFAQIGTPLDVHVYSFPVTSSDAAAVAADPTLALCQRTVCVFRSRAPPVLS
jgi:hypothetical protein